MLQGVFYRALLTVFLRTTFIINSIYSSLNVIVKLYISLIIAIPEICLTEKKDMKLFQNLTNITKSAKFTVYFLNFHLFYADVPIKKVSQGNIKNNTESINSIQNH
jgi:hypothetical protein